MHLQTVNCQAWPSVQLLVTNMTLEMLCFLVVNKNFFFIKIPITIPVRPLSRINMFMLKFKTADIP